jgi:hypothetical protein
MPFTKSSARYVDPAVGDPVRALENLICRSQLDSTPVVQRFVAEIVSLRDMANVSSLCFLMSGDRRPIGALCMMNSLVHDVQLPACVWSKSANKIVAGATPVGGERIIIIYDVCLTGDTIRAAADNLKAYNQIDTVAALVLFNESGHHFLNTKKLGFPVISIGLNETSSIVCASEFQKTLACVESAPHFSGRKLFLPSPLGSLTAGVAPLKEEPMSKPDDAFSRFTLVQLAVRCVPLIGATACGAIVITQPLSTPTALALLVIQTVLAFTGVGLWITMVNR